MAARRPQVRHASGQQLLLAVDVPHSSRSDLFAMEPFQSSGTIPPGVLYINF